MGASISLGSVKHQNSSVFPRGLETVTTWLLLRARQAPEDVCWSFQKYSENCAAWTKYKAYTCTQGAWKNNFTSNHSDNHRTIYFSSSLPDTKYARGGHSLNIPQQTKYWNKCCKQESSWNVRAEHAPKQSGTVKPYANWNKPLHGGYGITNTFSATTYGEWEKQLMKIRCLHVFWYRFSMHTTRRCCAGAGLVSREIHGCSLLTWTSICLLLRCLRNRLSTAKMIRRLFQWDSGGITSADPVIC